MILKLREEERQFKKTSFFNSQDTISTGKIRTDTKGKANKSVWRMPWHWEPMKDVVSCDKLRGAVSRH